MLSRLFVILQYILPKYFLTALVWRIARIRHVGFKDFLITRFVSLYNVDVDEVKLSIPSDFATFNDFFIRELDDTARTVDKSPDAVVSPVDGTVSSAGQIHHSSIFQAKGINYSLEDLLATDLQEASNYTNGTYATIYLAPYNYHRVHAPLDGRIVAARYVPGDLFSVNKATAENVEGLFRRNERLVLHFESDAGPWVMVFVGALNVGSISTPWSGEIRPRKKGVVEMIDHGDGPAGINKGDLLGWFNMGSTVVMLAPKGSCEWHNEMQPDHVVRMGERIGSLTANA